MPSNSTETFVARPVTRIKGASASFASYLVHPPNPFLSTTRKNFPLLFYSFWTMIVIAGVTFLIFLPHAFLWGVRDLFRRKEKPLSETKAKD
ncbi:MAG: hypothetical protein DRG71_04355 [Deltaproteobacteria bacterium]|nr:MAG: hypothetical protein DRG71_04355 [Deltaproteobacteria bacterium]